MNCDRCGHICRVLETRASEYQTRRRRECPQCGHRFTTVEVYSTFLDRFDKNHFRKWLRGAKERVNLRSRDMDIARRLHEGWRVFAQNYNLTESAVYSAARRGRKYIKEENAAHSHSREDEGWP